MRLSTDTQRTLQSYVDGGLSPADLLSWATSAEDDASLGDIERRALRELLLVLDEVGEGLRPVSEIMVVAARIIIEADASTWAGASSQSWSGVSTASPAIKITVTSSPA